ncbi:hypothetical protein BX616_009721 [Lobosporangium transversale]|uniref:DinB-like domain-containing protein n=1 Tax=Lobosporangium transversale TaxID=64571 RepID=A0A1Y2H375_9FUNG|nr:hypothetical protein BCR41DRAFT_344744 [Lobosporangium transversale]KAF9918258.1 hypothetical protein BX616_009721 [Lobosporangium transversale]ORZ28163.1 hypothetical protein BCR41DRAFT_344744 [Lobosporangium transversale]|eukprot:XP_021885848.1 hypothetical protein BCR41DRAFT_344744 [Lobosporangium transversale]
MVTTLEMLAATVPNSANLSKNPPSPSSKSTTSTTGTIDDDNESSSQHIFTVAARSLKDCADLLLSIKDAVAAEKEAEQDEGKHSDVNSKKESSIKAITPCKRSEIYTKPSALACQGTIGKHVRHLHDHYRILLTSYPPCMGSDKHEWSVDYDHRSREIPMETDIDVAISELQKLQHALERCRSHPQEASSLKMTTDLSSPVKLQATIDPSHAPVTFETTFGRELWFCSLHAVHHFAMIKVICSEFGITSTEGFGVAPSTLKNRMKA